MDDAEPLAGKHALVLGAGTPAGRAIAVALARAGTDVAVASSSIDGEEVMACRRTRRAVQAAGRRSAEYAFDVTLGQNVQVSTRQVSKEMDGLDILVWAVHAPLVGPTDKISDAEWSRSLAVNLSGAFFACRAALREMVARSWGRILLVAAEPATPSAERAAIQTAQSGLSGLARVIADEYGERGIAAYWLSVDHRQPVHTSADGTEATPPPHEIGALSVYLCAADPSMLSGERFTAVLHVPPAG